MVGFSLGGSWAVYLAARLKPQDIAAAVTFYGMEYGLDREAFAGSRAAFLGHFCETDPYEPVEEVREVERQIRDAGRKVDFFYYGDAGHWFFEKNRTDAYSPPAAELAWERTLAFLRKVLAE